MCMQIQVWSKNCIIQIEYLFQCRVSSENPNKVLCFTRTSPLIHNLPPVYPTKVRTALQDNSKITMKAIFDDISQLCLLKLSNFVTQTVVQDFISSFIESCTTKVCIILANMQETSKQIVNHLRIIIEETEQKVPDSIKLFVVVLYFAPVQFFKPCYPSLFLKGWDHYYMDTISHSHCKGMVDIRDWFQLCCIPDDTRKNCDRGDMLTDALREMIMEAVPILSSRLPARASKYSDLSQKEVLMKLLLDRKLGEVLCECFRSYWKPPVMADYLVKAASFTSQRESTLNINDSIQTMFKGLFFDFLVYMIHQINNQMDINSIIDDNVNQKTLQLFLDIIRVYPLPKLSLVGVLSTSQQPIRNASYAPSFPFFTYLSSLLDKVIEQSQEEANVEMDILAIDDPQTANQMESIRLNMQSNKESLMRNLEMTVKRRILARISVSNGC